jgi:hypothetical protein
MVADMVLIDTGVVAVTGQTDTRQLLPVTGLMRDPSDRVDMVGWDERTAMILLPPKTTATSFSGERGIDITKGQRRVRQLADQVVMELLLAAMILMEEATMAPMEKTASLQPKRRKRKMSMLQSSRYGS